MSDKHRGLYRKYQVRRLGDPKGKHKDCAFFVLDLKHDKFAKVALRAYAHACRAEYPDLAMDICGALLSGDPNETVSELMDTEEGR